MTNNPPVYKCWYITEEERQLAMITGRPFARVHSVDYFHLTNRIDSLFIEGHILRREEGRPDRYLNDVVRDRLAYLIDFQQQKKVYFTFDSINLYELIEFFPNAPQPLTFVLKRLELKNVKRGQVFMIMPFRHTQLNEFYASAIKPLVEGELGLRVYRGDDILDNDVIIETIHTLIEQSEIVIADTTFENKNAFYELGYAAAIKKEIITIQHQSVPFFFDRIHIRSIKYDESDVASFQYQLKSTIESIRARTKLG